MLSIWVQFVRNLLCVIKALSASSEWFQQPIFPAIGGQVAKTTIIEFVISITQLMGAYFLVTAGIKNIYLGILDLSWIVEVRRIFSLIVKDISNIPVASLNILAKDLDKAKSLAKARIFSGICDFIIGMCFCILCANSFHIQFESYPNFVIDGLLAMELALIYYLYVMYDTAAKSSVEKSRSTKLANGLLAAESTKFSTGDELVRMLESYGYGTEVSSILSVMQGSQVSNFVQGREKFISQKGSVESALRADIDAISESINKFCYSSSDGGKVKAKADGRGDAVEKVKGKKNEGEGRVLREREVAADRLKRYGKEMDAKWPLDMTYFALNVIAFWGYLLCIFPTYVPEHGSYVPIGVKVMKFYQRDAVAEWWGGLIGDIAWTIEPAIALYLAYMSASTSTAQKKPVDQKSVGTKKNVSASKKKK